LRRIPQVAAGFCGSGVYQQNAVTGTVGLLALQEIGSSKVTRMSKRPPGAAMPRRVDVLEFCKSIAAYYRYCKFRGETQVSFCLGSVTVAESCRRGEEGHILSKVQRSYVCGDCGSATLKWQGQCPACGEWNSLQPSAPSPASGANRAGWTGQGKAERLADVGTDTIERRTTGIMELDRVLGGGLVLGSVTLIGGDPGIGKSTLLLQACVEPSGAMLYVSGEESMQQIAMRAERLGIDPAAVTVYSATQIEDIVALAEKNRPACVVIDSVQTVYTDQIPSAP